MSSDASPSTDVAKPAVHADGKAHVRYPNIYVWLVFVSALDTMLTYLVLHFGGVEANAVAARVLDHWGFPGMVAYKFALIALTIVICEIVGRRDDKWGRRLGMIGIGLTCVPIVLALVLIAVRGPGHVSY